MSADTAFWLGFCIAMLIGCICARASYYNGANDGYGYAVDPACPGYWQAGRYLRRYLRHRWPEVMKGALDDPQYSQADRGAE